MKPHTKPAIKAFSVRLSDNLLKHYKADQLYELLCMKARVEVRSVNHVAQLIIEDYFQSASKKKVKL